LPFAIAAQSARLLDVSPDEQLELLRRFAPTLHFDALERWRPGLVDGYLEHSTVRDGSKHVLPGTPPAEAAMREHGHNYNAQLNPLGNDLDLDTYRRSTEMLEAYGHEQNLVGAGVAYGRVAPVSKAFFLQYWLFYPDNPCVLPPGRHDGDWELVQVKVERDGEGFVATQVTLAEHGKPATHPIDASRSAEGPDVFVAVDSHACYFMQGAHPALLSDVCDPAGGRGAKPAVTLLPIAPDKRDWVHWSGRWGLDRGGGTRLAISWHLKPTPWPLTKLNKAGDSPKGPGHQGTSWRFPKMFAGKGTVRKRSTVQLQRLAHLVGYATWPNASPRVEVRAATEGNGGPTTAYVVEAGTAGHFLRRVAFVSIAFFEQRPDGTRRGLGLRKVLPGQVETFEVPHRGKLLWRAAGYNVLRQRGNPVEPKPS
jgi:hypothetical protein